MLSTVPSFLFLCTLCEPSVCFIWNTINIHGFSKTKNERHDNVKILINRPETRVLHFLISCAGIVGNSVINYVSLINHLIHIYNFVKATPGAVSWKYSNDNVVDKF